jgi:hypothetical protein
LLSQASFSVNQTLSVMNCPALRHKGQNTNPERSGHIERFRCELSIQGE